MPIYEYQVKDGEKGCSRCEAGFELMQKISDARLEKCPDCGSPVVKLISAHSVGGSQSGLDDRAKAAGFHKLKKLGSGEYEKKY